MYLCACHTFQYWVRLKYLSLDLLLGELAADLCQVLEDQLGALSLACPGFPAGEGEEKKCKLFSVHFTIHSSFYNSEKKKRQTGRNDQFECSIKGCTVYLEALFRKCTLKHALLKISPFVMSQGALMPPQNYLEDSKPWPNMWMVKQSIRFSRRLKASI